MSGIKYRRYYEEQLSSKNLTISLDLFIKRSKNLATFLSNFYFGKKEMIIIVR